MGLLYDEDGNIYWEEQNQQQQAAGQPDFTPGGDTAPPDYGAPDTTQLGPAPGVQPQAPTTPWQAPPGFEQTPPNPNDPNAFLTWLLGTEPNTFNAQDAQALLDAIGNYWSQAQTPDAAAQSMDPSGYGAAAYGMSPEQAQQQQQGVDVRNQQAYLDLLTANHNANGQPQPGQFPNDQRYQQALQQWQTQDEQIQLLQSQLAAMQANQRGNPNSAAYGAPDQGYESISASQYGGGSSDPNDPSGRFHIADPWFNDRMPGYVEETNPITGQPTRIPVQNTWNYKLPNTIDVVQDNSDQTPRAQGFLNEKDYLIYKQSGGKVDPRKGYGGPNLGAGGTAGGRASGGSRGGTARSSAASLQEAKDAAQNKAMESWSQFLLDYMGKHPYGGQYVAKGFLPAEGSATLNRIPYSQELLDAFAAHPEEAPDAIKNPGVTPVGFGGSTYMDPSHPGNFGGGVNLAVQNQSQQLPSTITHNDPYYDYVTSGDTSGDFSQADLQPSYTPVAPVDISNFGYDPYGYGNDPYAGFDVGNPFSDITAYLDDDPSVYMPFEHMNGEFDRSPMPGMGMPQKKQQQASPITPALGRDRNNYGFPPVLPLGAYSRSPIGGSPPGMGGGRGPIGGSPPNPGDGSRSPGPGGGPPGGWGGGGGGGRLPPGGSSPNFINGVPLWLWDYLDANNNPTNQNWLGTGSNGMAVDPWGYGQFGPLDRYGSSILNRGGYEYMEPNNVDMGSYVTGDYSNSQGVYTGLQQQLGINFGPELYGQLTDTGSLVVPSAQSLSGLTDDQKTGLSDYATSVLGWNYNDLLKESQSENNRENLALPTNFK